MDLKDRKILITGANGGLGRAMAAAMAEHGAMLALCERTQALAEAAKAALPEPTRAQAHAFAADLTDRRRRGRHGIRQCRHPSGAGRAGQ